MLKFLPVIAALLFTATASAQHPDMIYIPLGMYYTDGTFVNAAVVTTDKKIPTFDTTKECLEFLQKSIQSALESGSAPKNGGVIGGCVPVHRLFPADAAT